MSCFFPKIKTIFSCQRFTHRPSLCVNASRADVICLQDVDFFHQWWGPQLTSAGYDSLFKQRTSKSAIHREGVVIAWKRDMFDLFRSAEMELNRCRTYKYFDVWYIKCMQRIGAVHGFRRMDVKEATIYSVVRCAPISPTLGRLKLRSPCSLNHVERVAPFLFGYHYLFRLGEHEEDRSLAGKAATSDNVALLALLQPWEGSDHPSGICVVCTQLYDGEGHYGDAVRSLQARGLTRSVEAFNSDFTLPIVMCGTMNCVPSSGTYHILCRGIEAQDPARPGAPGKPLVEPVSTSAARVRWAAPQDDSMSLSPAIDTYRLLWVPGGSRFLPGESLDAHEADCVQYDFIETESGNVRSEQNPLRSCVVAGLSSGVAYEFRVLAINSLGGGPWSERSDPVRMPRMAGNEPEDRVLLGAASIKLLRKRELEEAHHRAEERVADPRAYELRKLVKLDGLLDMVRENLHPFDSVSGMTPRYSDAMLHPDLANVRTDTGFPILELEEEQTSKSATSSTTRQRKRRQAKRAANSGSSRQTWGNDEQDAFSSRERRDPSSCCSLEEDASVSLPSRVTGQENLSDLRDNKTRGRPLSAVLTEPILPTAGEHIRSDISLLKSSERDQDVLRRLDALRVSGARSERQKHALGLRSAYMTYCSGGEPTFTTLSDTVTGTVDYILFSADCLLPVDVLSLPEMGSLVGRDIQQTEVIPVPEPSVPGLGMPVSWQGECGEGEDGYTGEWSPYLRENPRRVKHRIPNEVFPSDHLMLMANLVFSEARCPSTWR